MEGLEQLAAGTGVSAGYLYLCAKGHKTPTAKTAEKLVDNDPHKKLRFDLVIRYRRTEPVRKYIRRSPVGAQA